MVTQNPQVQRRLNQAQWCERALSGHGQTHRPQVLRLCFLDGNSLEVLFEDGSTVIFKAKCQAERCLDGLNNEVDPDGCATLRMVPDR